MATRSPSGCEWFYRSAHFDSCSFRRFRPYTGPSPGPSPFAGARPGRSLREISITCVAIVQADGDLRLAVEDVHVAILVDHQYLDGQGVGQCGDFEVARQLSCLDNRSEVLSEVVGLRRRSRGGFRSQSPRRWTDASACVRLLPRVLQSPSFSCYRPPSTPGRRQERGNCLRRSSRRP